VESADRVAEARKRLAAALDALPELDRVVLSLRLLDGLSVLEVAGALHVPVSEVERRTLAASRVLARQLGVRRSQRRVA
jgi:DNA-directed RNA polymerase specialized sigma24 family protein